MNLKKISLLTVASVLALASCKNAHNDVDQPVSGQETSGVLRIQVAATNGARATETNSDGRTQEQTVNKVNLYIFAPNGTLVDQSEYSEDANSSSWSESTTGKFAKVTDGILLVPFQTKAQAGVENKLVVILNQPASFTAPGNYTDFTTATTNAMALTYAIETDKTKFSEMKTDDKFMMVGCVPKFILKANKSFNDVKDDFSATTPEKNQYLVNADRSVSKLVVNIKNGVQIVGKEFGSGDAAAMVEGYSIDGAKTTDGMLYFTVANSNKNMYVYNNPRTTQVGPDEANGVVAVADANYKTPNMNFKSDKSDLAQAETEYKTKFYHISEDPQNIVTGNGLYAPIQVKTIAAATVGDKDYYEGKFFMEVDNSSEWLWANTPVAKIYACILPKVIYYLDSKGSVMSQTVKTTEDIKSAVTKDKTGDDNIVKKAGDGSFLLGTDGKYYASQAAADKNMGFTTADKHATTKLYAKGRCVYRFPVNANSYDYTTFENAYNKRNHIYNLTIEAIKGIGDNYDPTDPKDPNVPMPTDKEGKPLNPNEPTPDPNQPIQKTKTYAAVKCVIKPWTVVSNNVTLGN